jgi:hypothetical protein
MKMQNSWNESAAQDNFHEMIAFKVFRKQVVEIQKTREKMFTC